jgi:hypothetical protein
MSLPWWGWVALAVGAFLALAVLSVRSLRRSVREEFVRFLRSERPDWQVEIVRGGAFEIRRGAGEEVGTLYPHKLYALVAELRANDETARRPVYEKFLRVIEEGSAEAVDFDRDRERVLPRIVTEAQIEEMRQALGDVPAVPLGVAGLAVVVVLDSPESVRYLGAAALGELGLDLDGALALGKENLRKTFGGEVVRRAVESPDLNVVKSFDSHDATRLLLVPEHLHARETVIAMIPDRDTLVLVRPPADDDWGGMRKLARNAAGPPLWREPIRVTAEGFAPAP